MENNALKIQVFGSGCPTCHKLHERVKEALVQLGLDIEVEYIQDMQQILALGVMSVPVLVINDKIAVAGQVPDQGKVKEIISQYIQPASESCSCCGHC